MRQHVQCCTRQNEEVRHGQRYVASFLPSYERASLEVTVYTRASEERVERRMLTLDASNEFHFHSRELIAEGRGGVAV